MHTTQYIDEPILVSLFSRLSEEEAIEIKGVEATFIFVFADETAIEHDVYWCENGEIIPQDRSLSYDDMMGSIYELSNSTWSSGVSHYGIFVKADSDICDEPTAYSHEGVYTKKNIISSYIYSLDNPKITAPNYRKLH